MFFNNLYLLLKISREVSSPDWKRTFIFPSNISKCSALKIASSQLFDSRIFFDFILSSDTCSFAKPDSIILESFAKKEYML